LYNGKLFTFGPSYVGMTQLAILPGAGDRIAGRDADDHRFVP